MAASQDNSVPNNVVASIGDQLSARRRASHLVVAAEPDQDGTENEAAATHDLTSVFEEARRLKRRLMYDWLLVKRARFNASRRLRNRYDAGQFAFAVSGIYGFLVPLFLLQFDEYLSNFAAMVISFVAAVAGALSFTIAMQYQQKDFKVRAGQLHDCALKINELRRHLSATQVASPNELRPFINHYNTLLAACENHDDIDFALARLTDNPKKLEPDELREWKYERWLLKWRLYRQTYTICVVVWMLPLVVGLIVWLTLAPKG